MATFKETTSNQLREHLTVFLLWLSFHIVGRICKSGTNFYAISQIGILAGVAATTTLKLLVGMLLNTIEALQGIASVAASAGWKRATLHGMLLLGVVLGLYAAYFILAAAVFQDPYRYLTQCAGSPSLIAMELIVVMAYVPMHVWVAVTKHPEWLQYSCPSARECLQL